MRRTVRPARATGDAGVTLTELLITTTIVGIIVGSVLMVMAGFMRNDAAVGQRMEETRDLRRLAVYLPHDVGSAVVSTINTSQSLTSECPGYTGGGFNVLSLGWNDVFGTETRRFHVSYRVETAGATRTLVRVSCSGTTLGTATVTTIGANFAPWPAGWTPGSAPLAVKVNGAEVVVTLTEVDNRTLTVTATSQNPNATLV